MVPSLRVAIIGECMVELAPTAEAQNYKLNYSGDTFNTALYLARCSDLLQLQIYYVTALGDDPLSEDILNCCHAEYLQTDWIQQMPGRLPGLYLIRNDVNGEREFFYYRDQAPARELFEGERGDDLCEKLLTVDVWYLSGITLAILYEGGRNKLLELLHQGKKRNVKIVFDSNYRKTLWTDVALAQRVIAEAEQQAEVVLPSLADEQLLFNDKTPTDTIKRLQEWGVTEIIVKQGEQGYWIATATGDELVPAISASAPVIDTTGAGDAFNGLYLASRFAGKSLRESAQLAATLAATVVTHRGAIIPLNAMPKELTQRR